MLHAPLRMLSILLIYILYVPAIFALDKQVIGWLETVEIHKLDFKLKAKVDTGATTSSLHAKIIKEFTREGDNWVRFSIKNKSNQELILEKKIIRYVKIKSKLSVAIKRPVINLGVCIGEVYREEEVNLADRKNFLYYMLIGRNYLQGHFLVDSELMFTSKPSCK